MRPGVAIELTDPELRLSGGEALQPPGRLTVGQFKGLVAASLEEQRDALEARMQATRDAKENAASWLEAVNLTPPSRPRTAPQTR